MRLFVLSVAPFSWHTANMPAAVLDDLDALDLGAMKALVIAQQVKLSSRDSEIAHLKLLLDKLRRMLFGARSEKLVRQVEQLELQLEELEAARGEEPVAAPTNEPVAAEPIPEPVATAPTRRSLPEHLPREIETHLPEKTCCPDCGGKLRQFGEDVTEMLVSVWSSPVAGYGIL